VLEDNAVVGPVLDFLLTHAQRQVPPRLSANTKLWIGQPSARIMGRGLAQLLAQVDAHATLRKASQATGISYRHAWNMLRTAERHLGAPLIVSRPGGAGGGGTSLTPTGLQLMQCYDILDAELQAFASRRLAELLGRGDV
jgi:molybdate transport repressor ModE-like protein